MSDFNRFNNNTPIDEVILDSSSQELQDQVQKAQSELVELRRRQEQIEKEKMRLEELRHKQEEVEHGSHEMAEKIGKAMQFINRQSEETQRRLDHLNSLNDTLVEELHKLESIDPKTWVGRDLARELTKSATSIEEVRAVFSRIQSKIDDDTSLDSESEISDTEESTFFPEPPEYDFFYWLRAGLAFTLPLVILGILALLIFLWHSASIPVTH